MGVCSHYGKAAILREVSPADAPAHRVMLGIGEAGYYAGMIYYLSFW